MHMTKGIMHMTKGIMHMTKGIGPPIMHDLEVNAKDECQGRMQRVERQGRMQRVLNPNAQNLKHSLIWRMWSTII